MLKIPNKFLPLAIVGLGILLTSISTIANANTLIRQVIATGGDYMVTSDKYLGYTIGQPIISINPSQLVSGFWVRQAASPPMLVDLDSFTSKVLNGTVFLNWETVSEVNNAAFVLWRAEPTQGVTCHGTRSEDYKNIMKLAFQSTTKGGVTEGDSYSYKDTAVEFGKIYCYALEDIDFAGNRTFHSDAIISATVR